DESTGYLPRWHQRNTVSPCWDESICPDGTSPSDDGDKSGTWSEYYTRIQACGWSGSADRYRYPWAHYRVRRSHEDCLLRRTCYCLTVYFLFCCALCFPCSQNAGKEIYLPGFVFRIRPVHAGRFLLLFCDDADCAGCFGGIRRMVWV